MSPLPEGCWTCCGRALGRHVKCPTCKRGKCDVGPKAEPAKPVQRLGKRHEDTLAAALRSEGNQVWESFRRWVMFGECDPGNYVREFPIGLMLDPPRRFSADFFLPGFRLVVEVEGDAHAVKEQRRKDIKRRQLIEAAGFRVVAVLPEQVHDGSALALIRKALAEPE